MEANLDNIPDDATAALHTMRAYQPSAIAQQAQLMMLATPAAGSAEGGGASDANLDGLSSSG